MERSRKENSSKIPGFPGRHFVVVWLQYLIPYVKSPIEGVLREQKIAENS